MIWLQVRDKQRKSQQGAKLTNVKMIQTRLEGELIDPIMDTQKETQDSGRQI